MAETKDQTHTNNPEQHRVDPHAAEQNQVKDAKAQANQAPLQRTQAALASTPLPSEVSNARARKKWLGLTDEEEFEVLSTDSAYVPAADGQGVLVAQVGPGLPEAAAQSAGGAGGAAGGASGAATGAAGSAAGSAAGTAASTAAGSAAAAGTVAAAAVGAVAAPLTTMLAVAAGGVAAAGALANKSDADTSAPQTPVLALGTGVSGGATSAEATAAGGVVTVVAESGASTVVTFSNGSNTVSKTVTGNGSTPVAVTLSSADLTTLGNGTINVSAVATDAAGNASSAGTSSFTLDTAVPSSPTLPLGTGVANGATTAEATANTGVVTVVAESGASTVVTFSNGNNTVSKTVTGNGSTPVAVTLTSADLTTLGDGTINVSAVATDAAGNASTAGTSSFTLDSSALAAPTLALGTGVSGGATSAEATAAGGVVTVVAESGASTVVTFTNDSNTVSKTVTGNGSTPVAVTLTSADLTTLGDGTINVSAVATDAAGNASSAGTSSFTLDTTIATPVLALGTGVSGGATSAEATAAGGVVTVVAESGASTVVTFSNGSNTVSKTVTGNGSTPVAVTLTSNDLTTLGDGTINVSATATDAAGNASSAGTTSFTLDIAAPSAPTLALGTGVSDGANIAEATAEGGVVTVVAESDASTVVTFTNGNNTVSKTVTGNGSTPFAVVLTSSDLTTLGDGTINVSAAATDAAGNASAAGTSSFSIDALAPAAPTLALGTGVSNGATSAEATAAGGVVTVVAESGASTVVTFTNGSNTVSKTVTGNGNTPVAVTLTSADLSTLGDGTISVSATATDAAGNASSAGTSSFSLDTAIATPVFALGTGVAGGASATEAMASTGVVTLMAEAGATVSVTLTNGSATVTKTVTGNGSTAVPVTLSLTDLVTLGNGTVSVSATAIDAAGNTSASASTSFTLNTAIELADVAAGAGGFVINGQSATDYSGIQIASVGDVNGDGLHDLLIGAYLSDPAAGDGAGRSYVVFGRTASTLVDLSAVAAGVGGFVINGESTTDRLGRGVASAGDINGDGLADLLVAAHQSDFVVNGVTQTNAGRSYVIFGKTDTTAVDASAIAAGSGGFVINGQCLGDNIGNIGLALAGDVNGDGLSDLLVGAYLGDPLQGGVAQSTAGRSYVVFGNTGTAAIDLSTIAAGTGGFVLNGQCSVDNSGQMLSSAGDVNGDGLTDLIVSGAYVDTAAGADAGRAYVVFGKTGSSAIDLSAVAAGSGGFAVNGQCAGDNLAFTVSAAGDVNGDGLSDLVVGGILSDPAAGSNAGRTYVVFGKTGTAAVDASAVAAGSGGFVINGQCAGDYLGYVGMAGDINGDGLADLIMGARYGDPASGTDAGRTYVVFGKTGNAPIDASAIAAGSGGFVINGQSAGDSSGYRVTSAGDVNGDGHADLLVGVYQSDAVVGGTTLTDAGRSYVIFGGPQFSSGAVALGSGTSANELVVGTSGADTLSGGGGVDNFSAGAGNDTVVLTTSDVTNLASNTVANVKANVDGGSGYDTLRLSGGANLDLSAVTNVGAMTGVAGWSLSRINSIERMDLATDTAANTLTLSATDVNDMAGMNLIHSGSASADGKTWVAGTYALPASVPMHQLVVDATASDVLNLKSTGGAWALLGNVSHDGDTYDVYQSAATRSQVFVKAGAVVNLNVAPTTTATVTAITDNAGSTTGAVAAGGSLDDSNPVVSGTLSANLLPGEVLNVYDGATLLGQASVNGATWSFKDTRVLTHGQVLNYKAGVADPAGSVGALSAGYTATEDHPVPVITLGVGVSDVAYTQEATASTGVVTVAVQNGVSTVVTFSNGANSVTKNITGTGAAQAVTLSSGDLSTLGNGTINVSAVATYPDTVASGAAASSFTLSTATLAAPTIALASDTGSSASDAITKTGTVNLTGRDPSLTWKYSTDGGASWQNGTGISALSEIRATTLSGLMNGGAISPSARLSPGMVYGFDNSVAGKVTAWFLIYEGSFTKGVQIEISDAGGGGFEVKALTAAYIDGNRLADWATATPKSVQTVALSDSYGAYGVQQLTINGRVFNSGGYVQTTATAMPNLTASFVLPEGVYGANSIQVVQMDAAGNVSSPATLNATVDTTMATPTLALGTGVSGGATSAEATAAGGVVTVVAESGSSTVVTFTNGSNTVSKTVTGNGSTPVAVVLTSSDLTTLGDGTINVSATATDTAGNVSSAGTSSFTLDTAIATPTVALGTGVSGGATSAEATAAGGVITVLAESGASIVVTFTNGSNSVSKTVTGNGSTPVAVVLTSTDLSTLGDGTINVSAIATDAAGNVSSAGTSSFTIDTASPAAPTLALSAGVADGASATEAMASTAVTLVAEAGATVLVTLTNGSATVTKTVTGNGSTAVPVPLGLTDLATLGNGTVSVSATATDAAGNVSSASASTSFTLDIGIALADVAAGVGGFVINGRSATYRSGIRISSAGDVNGDGLNDLLVGEIPTTSTDPVRAYVVFGRTDSTSIDLSAVADGNGGFVMNGQSAGTNTSLAGLVISSAGDLNGDGLADLLIGAEPNVESGDRSGRSYVVFGKTDGGSVNLAGLTNGIGGYAILAQATGGGLGWSVSVAGDVNNDGLSDLIVGARNYSSTNAYDGRSYVIFGQTGSSNISLSAVGNGTGGFTISGQSANDCSGEVVSNAGDVNGDGLADLIVNSVLANSSAGRSYIVFGQTGTGGINLSSVAPSSGVGTGGFAIYGGATADQLGFTVASAGDVNGDGLADLIVGAVNADPAGGSNAGSAYVVFGKTDTAGVYASAVAAGTGGFVINGQCAGDTLGFVGNAGDINGDGLTDLIIGANAADPAAGANAGRTYVVFGKTGTAAIDASAIAAGSGGFVINGQCAGDLSGVRVTSAGDVNGDGYADLLVGASRSDPVVGGITLTDAGRSYVIFGGPQFASGAVALGSGTSANELVVGTSGADTLSGGGGVDNFSAGAGNDTVVLTASDVTNLTSNTVANVKANVDGGSGYDTLRLSGTNLDLTAISNVGAMTGAAGWSLSRINSIERMDLATDTAVNTLTLKPNDVNDMAGMNLIRTGSVSADGNTWTNLQGTPLGTTTAYHQLVVDGTASDSLVLNSVVTKPDVWTQSGQVSDGTSTYVVYQHEATRSQVLVKSGVQVRTDPDTYLALIENGVGGRVINGVQYAGLSGYSVSNAGDVNGDGLDDVIIGNTNTGGRVFVVFGQPGNSRIDLSAVANGTGGFEIKPNTGSPYSGFSVSSAGDVNGDGLADVLVGAYQDGASQSGRSYVVYGKTSTTAVQLSNLGTDGYSINGQGASDYLGYSVSAAGDVNGDGLADLLIGAYANDAAATDAGRAYVLYGKPGGGTSMTMGATVASTDGFVINGLSSNSIAGMVVSNAGDVNGDGYADLLVSASGPNSYVLFGKSSAATINLWNQTNTSADGFVISGANSSISNAGDVNGDGLSDLIVARSTTNTAYVVFGKTGNQAVAVTDLASGSTGFVINGQCTGDSTGKVSYAGDINGDGLADLLVGATGGDPGPFSDAGRTYVVYGKTGYGAVDLSAVDAGNGGFVINGKETSANSGQSVSYAGDINGDGFDDLLIGAHKATSSTGTAQTGMTYIVYGGTQFAAGQSTVALATGTSADELVVGSSGADTLTGGGGIDRFSAGDGNDAITLTASDVSNLANLTVGGAKAYVDGGGDFDTLRLSGGSSLDLTAIRNQAAGAMDGSSRINSIERLDLATDTAANTLTLKPNDVNDMAGMNLIRTGSVSADGNTWTNVSGTALSATTAFHQLVVDGTGSDVVNLKGAVAAWASAGTVSDGTSQYTVYQNASTNSQVIVKSGVTVNLNVAPVVLDLSGDGVLQYGQTLMDVNGDGVTDLTAWAGPQDGVLVHDANGDGRVNGATEFAFARHEGESDLQGLAAVFDSHRDGVLDMLDAQFAELAVWQDANGNGVSDAGELHSLSALGITAIGLVSDGVQRTPAAGVSEAGRTSAQLLDGSQMLVADAAFTFAAAPAQPDAAAKVMALFEGAAPATAQASGPCCPVSSHDPADLLLQQALLLQTH